MATCEHIQFTEYPRGIAYCHDCNHSWHVAKPARVIDWESREIYRVSEGEYERLLRTHSVREYENGYTDLYAIGTDRHPLYTVMP